MSLKVTVVGGAGRMGRWIGKTLSRDFEVHITDKDIEGGEKVAEELGLTFHRDYTPVPSSDIVIVSVPIKVTGQVIGEVAPMMTEGSLLVDVTSVKEGPVEAMEKHLPKGVAAIGSHPLFGPDGTGFNDKNVVLVPVEEKGWLERTRSYIERDGGNVRVMSAEEHDRTMAVVQGASHLLLVLFGAILKDQKYRVGENSDLTTPTFRLLLRDLDRVLVQNPDLYASIQTHNRYVSEVHNEAIDRYKELGRLISDGDTESLSRFIEEIDSYVEEG
ncbi:prephenate dehydrogenase/arogenate dehydrogenase family protein [Methanonatronarchaeum sp. AMET6-2]|uniref:prephenate dehydrogenase/arogenate dehydrogenase family protein n=1 Tax=Methanonatronarchaeum sp. AMET6-2 TaxID=2933293 RepID=UPI00120BC72B|nr:prephenate dehydrogenase/arogenate dehydrogenase family protein [Methanonatronarchaeum sp. AMET6-2]RZN62638.1 MAG: prephenate dehydrogenase/arogenate dehydrogenase family protein [Methanonatronarchaeia archaeon]UOY10039.1 prephenate dehydrogenase/arogenate dehydrogenase family protein [Methanonatronarchaeum sp. AMET6-2]